MIKGNKIAGNETLDGRKIIFLEKIVIIYDRSIFFFGVRTSQKFWQVSIEKKVHTYVAIHTM